MSFVLNASVTMAWCFEAEATPYTKYILALMGDGAEAWVPALWRLEVVNALLKAKRQGRITADRVESFLRELRDFTIEFDLECIARADNEILRLGLKHQLSSYDAAYLELAMRRGLPMATNDNNLVNALQANSLALVMPQP